MLTNADWRGDVYFPVEVSIACLDGILGFLLDIGAECNVDIQTECNNSDSNTHMTILDYVRAAIPALEREVDTYLKRAEEKAERARFRELAALPGWRGARGIELLKWSATLQTYKDDVKEFAKKGEKYLSMVPYFREAEEILVAHGAKSAKEIFGPDTLVNTNFHPSNMWGIPQYPAVVSYQRMTGPRSFDDIPHQLTNSYDELFEACRVGDIAKVQALCLPKDGKNKSNARLLQISSTFLNNQRGTCQPFYVVGFRHLQYFS